MGKYTFLYSATADHETNVGVSFSGEDRGYHISDVLAAFEQFLLGVTFQPGTIAKYIDLGQVHKDQQEIAYARTDAAAGE